MTTATIKPVTRVERALDYALSLFADPKETTVVRADAALAHAFEYSGNGKIVVRVNPARQQILDAKGRELRAAREERVNSAGAVREQKLKANKAAYEAAVAEIEAENRNIVAIADAEYEKAEQALLAEYAAPPAGDGGSEIIAPGAVAS